MAGGVNLYKFGHIILKPSVVFYRSNLSIGFVNIKPVLPGHVLVSPVRVVKRFVDLTQDEVSDLFISSQRIAGVVEREFGATSLTISIQDGPEAGQSVQHVHVHILPRKKGDFEQNDDIYIALQEHDKPDGKAEFRKGARSEEEMELEATKLAAFFKDNTDL
ncbi:predicted protein [Nematostella vectensis]|uniref:bis(5'-adenosyl)-triphosphatase n=1 Tax=Nematostella vectensis TaxID=45351 RepID=A7SWA8_NEMVE|nr:predicted protein [Nematostella vectensis]|eukprot:XP_001624129.1 predicted protein [Nematostella vectensis]